MESFDKHSLYQKIWELTREQLSVKYPFFRKLLWDFSFQESEDTRTAGTDSDTAYAEKTPPVPWRSSESFVSQNQD